MIELRWVTLESNPAAPKKLQYREVIQTIVQETYTVVSATEWKDIPVVIVSHKEYQS